MQIEPGRSRATLAEEAADMRGFWERFMAGMVLCARAPLHAATWEYLIDEDYSPAAEEAAADTTRSAREEPAPTRAGLPSLAPKLARSLFTASALVLFAANVWAQPTTAPSILFIAAHPDDESCSSATIYRVAKELGGTVDEAIITNGEGGYRYSALANVYYGINLTDEATGRARLPEIRKQEVLNAGRILGVRHHFFLDQKDARYTNDVNEALGLWNTGLVRAEIQQILANDRYDFVFVLFPTAATHGHHKAAAVLALEAVRDLRGHKPVVLGCQVTTKSDAASLNWSPLEGFAITAGLPNALMGFDRGRKFGFNNALSYQIVANWVVADHKSQGLFQSEMSKYNLEMYAMLPSDDADAADRVHDLFVRLDADRDR